MNEMTMDGFIRLMESQHAAESKWMGIVVTVPGSKKTEVIINPKENFKTKMDYYKKTYDENLVHRHNAEIKIVGYGCASSWCGLPMELGI